MTFVRKENIPEVTSEFTLYRCMSPWLYNDTMFALSPSGRELRKNLDIIHGFANDVIAERKKEFAARVSDVPLVDDVGRKRRLAFLDVLVEASKGGTVLTDTDIREEVDVFMFGGYDTVAFSTAITLYLLATHPHHQKKVTVILQ